MGEWDSGTGDGITPPKIIFTIIGEVGEWDNFVNSKVVTVVLHLQYSYHTVICVRRAKTP